MGNRPAAGVLVLVCSTCACAAGSEPAGTPAITVRVHTAAGFESRWPDQARDIAAAIFRNAGLSLTWIDCTGAAAAASACAREPGHNEFVVRIRERRDDPGTQGCGVSLRPVAGRGHYVTVFQDCIAAQAAALEIPEAVVGAHALGHEIGHLLLPVGHAAGGIMRATLEPADWTLAVRGRLLFTPDEGRQMRDELRRRLEMVDDAVEP